MPRACLLALFVTLLGCALTGPKDHKLFRKCDRLKLGYSVCQRITDRADPGQSCVQNCVEHARDQADATKCLPSCPAASVPQGNASSVP
ncbi:MAG: hypothetical protein H6716_18085 [Polyangiaceae bacterium]|nr:hypothetical protein [Polyangiaceae bacterium]